MQQIDIWLVILFLSLKTSHAKQIFVLTSYIFFPQCASTFFYIFPTVCICIEEEVVASIGSQVAALEHRRRHW